MKSLKRMFASPTFDDELKTQQAYMLHIILWTLIFVPIPYVIYTLVLNPENSSRALAQAAFGEATNILLLIALHRGFVKAASTIQVGAFWLFFTVTAFTENGVHGEAYLIGYTLVVTIAGILLGGTGALAFTILSLVSGAYMVYLQLQGALDGSSTSSPLTTWIVSFVLFPIGAILQRLASDRVRSALSRARASEERYRLISQISSDYTFSTALDAEGNMYLNWVAGAFEEITGFSYDEYVASGGWLAHLHPGDFTKNAEDTDTLKANKPVITEVRTFKKDREMRWVRVYANPVWEEKENRLTGIVGAVQDITERKQAEEALTQERDLLQIFLDNIPDTVYIKDIASRFIRINKAQAKFLKLDRPEDVIGKTDLDFQPHELAAQFMEEEKHIMETGQSIVNRVEFNPTEGGEPRWLAASKAPVRDFSGRIIGTIGISRDITNQKLSEEREANRRVYLEKILEISKQVTETKNLQTTLERIWYGVHDVLGFDRLAVFLYNAERNSMDSMVGTDVRGNMQDTSGIWYPVTEAAIFMRVLERPDGLYFTHNYDVENNIPEGDEMFGVKDYAAVAVWAGDKPVAVICVDQLVTKRRITDPQLEALRLFAGYAGLAIENSRLNEALQTELDQRQTLINELENKNAELERFTYTVSHDLKSPLVTITGFLGYLEKDAAHGNKERVKSSVSRIASAAKKMQALLNDLLELSRIGRLMNPPVDVPFEEIVNEAVDHVRGQLDEVDAIVEIQRDLTIVHGDRVRLVEVVQNLVENAVKYSNPRVRLRIEIGMNGHTEKGCPIFHVRDNGIGIEPQYHERIFGLFNKLDVHSEGTGIGLSLVKRIIEVHNGRIWVESEPGKGATFYFSLPASKTKE